MRKFGLFLCLSLLFAFTGCSDSDDVEEQGGTVLAKPSVAVTTTTSSSFRWRGMPYPMPKVTNIASPRRTRRATNSSCSPRTRLRLRPSHSATSIRNQVYPARQGRRRRRQRSDDSEYSKIFATTLAEEAAELTFEKIAATNPTYESVDVEIVPSAENLYYWQVVENSLIEGKSDREIVAALKENISELSSGTSRRPSTV